MDENYNQELDEFTTKLIHYDNYVDNKTVANIIEELFRY